MSIDQFTGVGASDSPSEDFFSVTPNDSVDLTTRPRAIYVGGAGDVVVRARDNITSVTFKNVPAGSVLPIRSNRILSTGTTATYLIALL